MNNDHKFMITLCVIKTTHPQGVSSQVQILSSKRPKFKTLIFFFSISLPCFEAFSASLSVGGSVLGILQPADRLPTQGDYKTGRSAFAKSEQKITPVDCTDHCSLESRSLWYSRFCMTMSLHYRYNLIYGTIRPGCTTQ